MATSRQSAKTSLVDLVRQAQQDHPGINRNRLAEILKVSVRQIANARKTLVASSPQAQEQTAGVVTLKELRRRFDVPSMIRAGIKTHLKPDTFVEDHKFRELCGVPVARWRRIADSAEFCEHRMKIDGVLHWARSESITEAKSIMGLG